MPAAKVIAICLGKMSNIKEATLREEYHEYQADHKLRFYGSIPSEQNIENLALRLAQSDPDADILVAAQGSVHPIEGVAADEVHIFFKGDTRSFFVEFYSVKIGTSPTKGLARDLALLSRARSNIQTH